MNVYLAGIYKFYNYLFNDEEIVALTKEVKPNFLESYYYIRVKDITKLFNLCSNFLLDSGAFTLRQNSKDSVNWVEYIKEYASFINKYDIKYFFELDIDNLVGYEKVKEYRKLLENLTCKKCISVWHPSRGFEEFTEMCKEYDYVSIGGIAYIPNGKVLGLSKFARIADMVGKRLQLQERIGSDIADIIMKATGSNDVIVVIEGEHSCMTSRGIKSRGSKTRTATLRGSFKDNTELRKEVYSLMEL